MLSLKNLPGRFGNTFFRNIYFHFMCEKYKINIDYCNEEQFNKFGIYFNNNNNIAFSTNTIRIDDNNCLDILNSNEKYNNFTFELWPYTYFQLKEFSLKLYDYFHNNIAIKNKIIYANLFK